MKILTRLLVIILFFVSPSFADRVNVFEFTEAELADLQVRKVRGADNKTEYSVGSNDNGNYLKACLLYTSPSPRDATLSRMPSSA